jgi:hypothetical protein
MTERFNVNIVVTQDHYHYSIQPIGANIVPPYREYSVRGFVLEASFGYYKYRAATILLWRQLMTMKRMALRLLP